MAIDSHLFLGGARSGKSSLALSWACGFAPERFFLATAEPLDEEMARRIAVHQEERAKLAVLPNTVLPNGVLASEVLSGEVLPVLSGESSKSLDSAWNLLEEPLDIAKALRDLNGRANIVLLDCLTMWVSNQLFHLERASVARGQEDALTSSFCTNFCPDISELILAEFEKFCAEMENFSGAVALVSNELGLGLVPDNSLGRLFRDIAGKVNQRAAQVCAQATFVAAGLPLPLKRGGKALFQV